VPCARNRYNAKTGESSWTPPTAAHSQLVVSEAEPAERTAEESAVTEKIAPALVVVAAAEQGTGAEAGSEEAAAASASAPAELAGDAAIWQQMTDEASGRPYWSRTRCVLPDERARVPLPLLPLLPKPVPRTPCTRSSPACRQHVTGALCAQQV
jgi:hypothetical protein